MTNEEKILAVINQKEHKENFVMVSEHYAKEQIEYAKMLGDEAYESATKDYALYKEAFSYEKLCPLLIEIFMEKYTEEEINYLYEQSLNPIIKQIAAKAGEVNIAIMEKFESFVQQELR